MTNPASAITCPDCGHSAAETMPPDAFFSGFKTARDAAFCLSQEREIVVSIALNGTVPCPYSRGQFLLLLNTGRTRKAIIRNLCQGQAGV
ncbi:MAG: hypothetical protein AB8B94_11460 [Hyphomicrobiales bacterium]